MLDGDQVEELSTVRSYTAESIEAAFEADDPVLVESPPSSGKTTAALELAASANTPVTYLCGRIDLYEEAKRELEETQQDIDFVEIPSPHRDCPSFSAGSPGDQDRLKKLYSKGYSGRKLHFLPKNDALTPCGEDCEYLQKLDKVENRIDEIDVLIGHHSHSHRNHYLNDRIVILDEFNADAFITSYPNPNSGIIDDPEEIIPAFVESVATEKSGFPSKFFRDFTDLLVQRQDEMMVDAAVGWFTKYGASRGDAEDMDFLSPSSFQHDRNHLLAPFLTLSLLCMERVGPEIEMAPHPNTDTLDIWKAANLNPSTRVVRNRNTSKMTVLRPPDFSQAKQVVGLDGTPTLDLWNLLLPPASEFDLQRVTAKSDFTDYLESALNMSLIQIGDGMHHYASGRISPYDLDRFRAINAIEGKRLPLISSKQAIQKYWERGWVDAFVAGTSRKNTNYNNLSIRNYKTSNFASIRSSNTFEDEDLGMVFGTPYPGDDVIKRWAGLCGVGVVPQKDDDTHKRVFVEPSESRSGPENAEESEDDQGVGIDQSEKTTEGIGQKIYEHYVHNQVVQAVLRFGRDESVIEDGGATVYISTHALPSWFDVTDELTVSPREKEAEVVGQLYDAFVSDDKNTFSYQTASSLKQQIETTNQINSISERHVRETLNTLVDNNIAECREGYAQGGADQYRWNPDTRVETVLGRGVVSGTDMVFILNRAPPNPG